MLLRNRHSCMDDYLAALGAADSPVILNTRPGFLRRRGPGLLQFVILTVLTTLFFISPLRLWGSTTKTLSQLEAQLWHEQTSELAAIQHAKDLLWEAQAASTAADSRDSLDEAETVLRGVLGKDPENDGAQLYLGHVLRRKAAEVTDAVAYELYREANNHLDQVSTESADELHRDYWRGDCSYRQALTTVGLEAKQLDLEAIQRFRHQLALNDDYHSSSAVHLASALELQSKWTTGTARLDLLNEEQQLLQAVLLRFPADVNTRISLGHLLSFRTAYAPFADKPKWLEQASFQFAQVLNKVPSEHHALYGQAFTKARLAVLSALPLRQQLFSEAEALIDGANSGAYHNYYVQEYSGLVYNYEAAMSGSREDALRYANRAISQFRSAWPAHPAHLAMMHNLANALLAKTRVLSPAESCDLVREATELAQQSINLDPDDAYGYAIRGNAKTTRARCTTETATTPTLCSEAETDLLHAIQLIPESAPVSLARLYALEHNEAKCREWLTRADELNVLTPDCRLDDSVYDEFRKAPWFQTVAQHGSPQ